MRGFLSRILRFIGELLYEARVKRVKLETRAKVAETKAEVAALDDDGVDDELRRMRRSGGC